MRIIEAPAQKTAKGTENRPAGFGGIWAPPGGTVPPGYTDYSWHHAQGATKEEALDADLRALQANLEDGLQQLGDEFTNGCQEEDPRFASQAAQAKE